MPVPPELYLYKTFVFVRSFLTVKGQKILYSERAAENDASLLTHSS